MRTYRFNTTSQSWEFVPASDLGMTDDNGWDGAQYYSTIQTGDIDGDGAAELLARAADGMHTYRFNTVSQDWEDVGASGLGMLDYAGWDQPQYYSTIQTGDIDGDGAAELLARRAAGLDVLRFNTASQDWEHVLASGLGMGDRDRLLSSTLRLFYPLGTDRGGLSTLDQSLGDFLAVEVCGVGKGDGAAELLARRAAGMYTYRFDIDSQDWELVAAANPGMSDYAGWDQPQYYTTIRTADIDGDGAAELLARAAAGMRTYRFNTASQSWDFVPASDLGMTDGSGWDQHKYYSTIQTGDIDGDGAAELLARYGDGLHVFRFNAASEDWEFVPTSDLGMTDGSGWDQHKYYSTIQTGDIDGDGAAELLARYGDGLHVFRFNTDSQDWDGVPVSGLGMDTAGWDLPEHYSTIQTGDIDGDGAAELLARYADGLHVFRFSTGSQDWDGVPASPLGMGNADGWCGAQYYSTIQTGDIDGDGAAELLARYADGLHVFRFNTGSQDWDGVPASPLGMGNADGWCGAQYYSTIQTADIDGDGAAELLARRAGGMHTYRFDTGSQDWELVAADNPGMSDYAGWYEPQFYTTIQTGDIDGDGAAELLARAAAGMRIYRFNTTSQFWERVPASDLGMIDGTGWDQPRYYSTIQTGDVTGCGTVAVFTDTIQLDDLNLLYRVDWQVANQDIGEPFEVHFAVAGLRLGFASHTPDRAGAVPIRFRVDNHPLIRAWVLHEQGRSATEVAQVLVEEFNCSVSGLWVVLREAGLDVVEFGEMLRDLYEIDAQGAAQVMKSVGLSAFEAGLVLRDVYGQNAAAVAMILYDVGYPIADVIAAVEELFGVDATFIGLFLKYHLGLDAVHAARTLKDTGHYQIHQVYEVLVNVYGVANWEDARQILLDAGYSDEEITEEVMAAQLAARFAPVLKFDQAASTFPMDAQKWWEDMLCGDDGGPPPDNGGYDYEACRTHSDGWGTENINDLWQGNSGISTLWEYGNKVPTYYRVESCGTRGQVRIEYWWFYGWQPDADTGCGQDHRADWEHIMVTTSEDWTDIAAVTYYQHSGWYTRIHGGGDPNFELEGTHPVVYVGKTAHGSYYDDGGSGSCCYYEDYRNPSANSIWRTWQTPLIDLRGEEQAWLGYDRTADWEWGYNSVGTHPTVATPDLCQREACEGWDPIGGYFDASGCITSDSDCKTGDCDCGSGLCSYSCWACFPGELYAKDYWIPTSDDELMP
jgi:hypothetical protein